MNRQHERAVLQQQIDALVAAWANGCLHEQRQRLAEQLALVSNQHGRLVGAAACVQALQADTRNGPMACCRLSNRYLAIHEDLAVGSLYLFGQLAQGTGSGLLFGATLVLQLKRSGTGWLLDELRIDVPWTRGDRSAASHWQHLPSNSGWQPGDPAPAIVSELHAPWRRVPQAAPSACLEEAAAELYARYAFAVDQSDIDLLAGCYSEDIHGGFMPLGALSGRDTVVGMLKQFRQLAPFWQHFADVLWVREEGDGCHAQVIVGRIVPERAQDASGRALYGAHYQLRIRKVAQDPWRICWSDYRPGWFTADDIPAFDIGQVTA